MSDHTPETDLEALIARLLDDPEPGHDAMRADPTVRRVIELLDQVDPDDEFEAPPDHLWAAIAAGVDDEAQPDDDQADGPADDDALGGNIGGGSVGGGRAAEPGAATVTPLGGRRRTPQNPPWWLGAAAAVFVVLVVLVSAIAIFDVGEDEPDQVASAELDVLLDVEASGQASLVRVTDEDDLVLHVDVSGLEPIDGYYEVWLLTPAVDGLISLGPLRSDGRYELPRGLDPTQFSVVDISIEPHDGDPNHSGNSVLRGGLVEA